jgi:purine-binding chemotaxis protein CheW
MASADALAAFFSESDAHIEVMEASLLKLESELNVESVNELFRSVHSLKGNAGLVGFSDVHALATEMETLLDGVRKGEKKFDPNLREGLFKDLDKIKGLVEKAQGGPASPKAEELPTKPEPKRAPKAGEDAREPERGAQAPAVERPKTRGRQSFLTFDLKNEEYGIPIVSVKEIILRRHITRVPKAKKFVAGIMNLRGMVIPVIDSGCKLGMGADGDNAENIIIVENEHAVTGMLVDRVRDVVTLEENQIIDGPDLGGLQSKFIRGVGRAVDKNLILLDVTDFCNPNEKYY